MTFAATTNAGLYLGAKPIFVDIEESSGNIDVKQIEKVITKKTKMIVPVHYAGNPVDVQTIHNIARKHKLIIVEDACHALGAKYGNQKIGSCQFSHASVFSFHPVKHITTGEGGAVTTNSKGIYEKMLMFRTHGITKDKKYLINKSEGDWYYEMQYLGFNYRLTDIQATLGISQLKKINQFVAKRRRIAQTYNLAFKDNPYFNTIEETKFSSHAYHLYPILLKDKYKNQKKGIFEKMRQNHLGAQVHYLPVYLHPYYKNLGYKRGLCPSAEDFYQREISIPLYPSMTDKELRFVINQIFQVFRKID